MKSRILFFFVATILVLSNINCSKNIEGLTRVQQTLSGTVELGSPVAGAYVTAYAFNQLERGDVLGTAITDEKGDFKIEHHHPYRGPVLLVASNGSFLDPATKIQMFVPANFTLRAAIADSAKKASSNINALTTLSGTLAETDSQRKRINSRAWVSLGLLVDDINDYLSIHFSNEKMINGIHTIQGNLFNYADTAIWDYTKETLAPSEPRALVYLVHAGLSQMAKTFSKKTNQEPGAITIFNLMSAFMTDLQDGKLDGLLKQEKIYIDSGKQIELDSYFLRYKLAISIQLFINELKSNNINIGFDGSSFLAKGGFYERMSTEAWQEGPFDGLPEAIPFDTEPPEITMEYGGKYAGKMYIVLSREDVVVEASAVDTGVGMKSFKILEPANLESTATEKNKISIIIKTSMMPNAATVIARCGYNPNRNFGLGPFEKPPTEESACVCVEAKDLLDNTSYQVRCVQRPNPIAEMEIGIGHRKLGADAFAAAEQFNVSNAFFEGTIYSGWDLLTCGWRVITLDGATEVSGVQLPWGQGLIQSGKCVIHEQLPKEKLPDGNYRIALFGEDILGRLAEPDPKQNRLQSEPFEVYQTPPVLEITSPEAEIRTNASKVAVHGSVRSGIAIRDVYAEVQQGLWHSSTSGRQIYGDVVDGKWSIVLDPLAEQGVYTYVVHAIDIYGNHSQLAPRLIVIDREPPTIKGHREGVAQGSYAQEHSTVSVFRDGTPGLPHFQFKSNGTQTRIPWDNIPVLYRWASQLNDEKAPSYEIQVEDESGMKEVRWVHGTKCLPIEKAKNIAELIDGKAILSLTALTAEDKLETAIDENSPRCISVWAVDKAGNTQNQQISFRWRTVAPPIVVDFNSPLYDPTQSEDDMVFSKRAVQDVYNLAEHSKDKDGYVVAHALLHNPHDIDLDFKMEDNSAPSIELKLKEMVVLGKDTVVRDWVYHGTTEQRESPGEPRVPDPDWGLTHPRYHAMNSSKDFGALMHISGPSGNPTKITHVPVYELLSNPKSPSNLAGSMKDCSKRQPAYSKICAANEVTVLAERQDASGNECSQQKVECLPESHRYGVVNTRDKPVFTVGEQVVTKQSTIVKLSPRYFAFDPATKQVQEEVVAIKDVVRIPNGKTMLVKWYLGEQNVQIGLKSLEKELPNSKLVGECKQILYSKGNAETCDKAECKIDKVCFSLDGVQVRLAPKVAAQKKAIGILSATTPSPFRYSTQTDAGAVSDDFVPVVLESPISRLVTK